MLLDLHWDESSKIFKKYALLIFTLCFSLDKYIMCTLLLFIKLNLDFKFILKISHNSKKNTKWNNCFYTVHWVRHDWATSLSLFIFMHRRRKWQPTPVFLPGESQGSGSLVGCHLWGRTESDRTEVTWQQQQQVVTKLFYGFWVILRNRGISRDLCNCLQL